MHPLDPFSQAMENFYATGAILRPALALTELQVGPRKFLRRYAVACDEIVGHAGGLFPTYFYTTGGNDSLRPGRHLRTFNMHTSNSYHFSLDNPPVGRTHNMSVPVSAYYVPMLPATATTTYAGLVWTPIGNLANIMLTVQLSGCSFLWRMHNGQLECCHYQPTAGIDGLALQQQLTGPGRNVYGREDYGEGRVVTIIGIRRGGQWRIYAQKFRVMTKEILSVHRLHPA